MEKAVRWTNNYSGLLSFISFIGLILFWIFGMQAGLEGISSNQKTSSASQKEYQQQTIAVLTQIRDSLKDRGTDHKLFSEQLRQNTTQINTNTVAVNRVSEAVVRISFALESIEKSISAESKRR